MTAFPLVTLLLCGFLGAGPSPGEHRANVPVTIEGDAWALHVPPSHKGPVELHFVEKPASVTESAAGTPLPFQYDAGTATFDPPAPLPAEGCTIAVAWKDERYDKDMQAFAGQDRQQPPKQGGILFVGSSTIRIWKLEENFPGLNALNRGFGGSRYSDAVSHFQQVIVPYHPATVVIYDGDNDIAGGRSPEWVFADFEALMRRIRFSLPETRVIVLSIKPCPARWKLWDKMKQMNAMVGEYTRKQEKMLLLDMTAEMLDADGNPRPELFQKDGLHLNAQGYGTYSARLKPLLEGGGG